jgi:general secretion pathway protein D
MKKYLPLLPFLAFCSFLILCAPFYDRQALHAEEGPAAVQDAAEETAKPAERDKERKVTVNFVDVDISSVVKFISEVTGKNFVFDDRVKGSISVIAPSRLTVDEAFSLFTSVLELKGFTVVPSGKVYKIVPLSEAKQSGPQIVKEYGESVNDAFITRLIALNSISSTTAMNFLQPLVSREGHISSFGPGNMLMIVDSAMNIEQILKILDSIDKPGVEEPELILMKHADAEEVSRIITEALSLSTRGQTPRAGRPARPGESGMALSVEEKRSYVFADARLNAVVLIADKQEREAMKRMISLLDIPLPEATSKINVYFLEYADTTELSEVLQKMLAGVSQQARAGQAGAQAGRGPFGMGGKITISPDKATNSLVIVASPADYQNLTQVIKQLDRKRKQVYVEAMIVEASIDNLQDLGTKWRIIAEKDGEPVAVGGFGEIDAESMQGIIYGLTGLTAGGMGNFLDIPVSSTDPDGNVVTNTLTVPGFAALFSLNEFKGSINVLSTPQILTSDNREAEIIVGENVPFISQKESDASRPQSVFTSIERTDVGITLRLTPQISEGDYIKLDIYHEISALKQESLILVTTLGPTTTKRSTKTSVVVKDKQTVVIGGLMEEREEENITKVPLLGDIPLLGWLFKTRSIDRTKKNLLIFLTPHIIREAEQLAELSAEKDRKFAEAEKRYRDGELLVKFRDGTGEERIAEIVIEEDAVVIAVIGQRYLYHLKLEDGQDVEDAIEAFSEYPEVEYAEPNFIRRIQTQKGK